MPFNFLFFFSLQDSERLQMRSHDLEHQLSSKEKELEHLFQKQKKVCAYLHALNHNIHLYNVKILNECLEKLPLYLFKEDLKNERY